jgi:hypothetical protein
MVRELFVLGLRMHKLVLFYSRSIPCPSFSIHVRYALMRALMVIVRGGCIYDVSSVPGITEITHEFPVLGHLPFVVPLSRIIHSRPFKKA